MLFCRKKRITSNASILLLVFAILGCADVNSMTLPRINIDSRFSEFYNLMGGEAVLGKVIGPIYSDGAQLLQFTENTLVIYDESLPAGERYNFIPLGNSFQISDPPLPVPENQGEVRYVHGHVIFSDFVPLYDQLGGSRFVGNPLTEVRMNTEKSRYEQYFEKMGFYRNIGSGNSIHLLPYGLIACRQIHPELGCNSTISDAHIESANYLPQPFLPVVQRLGDDFTGAPLSQPYLAADGYLEQIYENIVLAVNPNNLRTITLRNLPERVGLMPTMLTAPLPDRLMAFVLLDTINNLGHNVPTPFLEYIAAHGGNELAGQPTSELYDVNGIRRQCFTNYCLDYDPSAPVEAQIHPAPLGYRYQNEQNYIAAQLHILVWETNPAISQGEQQVLGVKIYNGVPEQPVKNTQPTLELSLPNGKAQQMIFPPTSEGGTTYLSIKLPDVPAGAIVSYQVCVTQPGSTAICVKESWLVR